MFTFQRSGEKCLETWWVVVLLEVPVQQRAFTWYPRHWRQWRRSSRVHDFLGAAGSRTCWRAMVRKEVTKHQISSGDFAFLYLSNFLLTANIAQIWLANFYFFRSPPDWLNSSACSFAKKFQFNTKKMNRKSNEWDFWQDLVLFFLRYLVFMQAHIQLSRIRNSFQ